MRRALGYVRPYAGRLALVVVLSLVSTALSLAQPFLSKVLVDRALIGRDFGALGWTVAGFLALTGASLVLNVFSGLRYTRVSADILFDMRLDVFRHLQRLSPRWFTRTPIGQIASRVNSDIAEIQRVAAEVALAWIGQVAYLVGSVVMLVLLDVRLFAVGLLALPLALWAMVAYRKRLEGQVAKVRDHSAGVGTFLIEALQSGHLGGAYLDVFTKEPLDPASPFWDMPNVIVSPHNSAAALGNDHRVATEYFLPNLARMAKREPLPR